MDKLQSDTKSNFPLLNDELRDMMKHSYEFWHKNYSDSLVNYSLVWKKALTSNFEIMKKMESWRKNSYQNTESTMEQFLEIWSQSIRESTFEMAKKSIQSYEEIWKDMSEEQFREYAKILQILESYWKDIQRKSIE